MKRKVLAGAFVFLGMIWLSPARPAWADVDVSGCWVVQAFFDRCWLEFSLSGTEVTATGSCYLAGPVDGAGTFDAASGHFSISGSAERHCRTFEVDATVAPDGTSFAGTVHCEDSLGTLELAGSLDGNGLLCATDDALREAIDKALRDYQRLGLRGLLAPEAVGFGFAAPSSGELEVRLVAVLHARYVLVARGHAEIEAPGQVVVQLGLTRRGRRLLRHRKRVALTLEPTFTRPSGTVTEADSATVFRLLVTLPPEAPHQKRVRGPRSAAVAARRRGS